LVHLKCVILEANRTRALLESLKQFPISLETWNAVLEQRVAENEAHDQYRLSRQSLFNAIKPQSILIEGLTASSPL